MDEHLKVAIFASGGGTNAEKIVRYLQNWPSVHCTIYTNNPKAGVIARAGKLQVPVHIFNREAFYQSGTFLEQLQIEKPNLVVLAGFLWLVPPAMIKAFANKVVNIHPALLPNFGGKGMYGKHVHQAVIDSGAAFSGITIHYVTENYDEGPAIFQSAIKLDKRETPETLAQKIHALEHRYYPKIVADLLGLDATT